MKLSRRARKRLRRERNIANFEPVYFYKLNNKTIKKLRSWDKILQQRF